MRTVKAMVGFVLLAGAVQAGSHSAAVNVTVDTRDSGGGGASAPVVQSIEGDYFRDSKPAYFLTGLSVSESIEADVDWKGQPAGTIQFKRGSTVLQSSSSDTLTYNVGNLSAGQTITVQAISDDGTKVSTVKTANFSMVPLPPFLAELGGASVLSVQPGSGAVKYTVKAGTFWRFWEEDLDSVPNDDSGDRIPGCTGNPLKWDVSLTVAGSVDSSGNYSVDVSYNNGNWNMLGHSLKPAIGGGLHGSYGGSGWSLGGQANIGLNFYTETPPVYLWAAPPVYAEAYLRTLLAASGSMTWHSSDGLLWHADLSLDATVGLIAGVGIDHVAAVEVFGGGGPYFVLALNPPDLEEYGISFEAGIRLIFLFYTQEFSVERSLDLTGAEGGSMEMPAEDPAFIAAVNRPQSGSFQLMSRDYLTRPVMKGMAMDAPAEEPETDVIQSDGFPYSDPSLNMLDDGPVLLWLKDESSRLPENRTMLVWQENSGGTWGAESAVWDDGTADFAPDAVLWSNGLLAAFQNTGIELPEGAELEDAFAEQEIAVGLFDGAVWACTNLTDNGRLDHSPKISSPGSNTALLAWISNPSNSPSGAVDMPNDVMFSSYDGTGWSAPQTVATNLGMMIWSSLAYNGSTGVFVCCRDMDDDQSTKEDQELFAAVYTNSTWGSLERLTDDAVQDTNPQLVYDASGRLLLAWFRDGSFMTDRDLVLSDALVAGTVPVTSSAMDYRLVAGPDGEINMLWETLDTDGELNPHVLSYDPALDVWSAPVAILSNSNRLERSFSGAYTGDGNLMLAYNSVHISTDTNGLPQMGAVDLCATSYSPGTDLAVRNIEISEENPPPGTLLDITVEVVNRGVSTATNVMLALFDGDPAAGGESIEGTNLIAAVLGGGASATGTVYWLTPPGEEAHTLYAVVDPALAVDDLNRANNTAHKTILAPDLSVGVVASEAGGTNEAIIEARIENSGALTITNAVAVSFHRGSVTGAVLGTANVYPVEPGSGYDASIIWDLSGLTFTSAYEEVYVVADSSGIIDEQDETDNTGLTPVMTTLDSDGDGLRDGEEIELGTLVDEPDSDGDGLTDFEEVRIYGTVATLPDTDGDGMDDGDEIQAGTDPLSQTDVLSLEVGGVVSNYYRVTWPAVSGKTYQVKTTVSLMESWTNAVSGTETNTQSLQTAPSNTVLEYLNPVNPAEPVRYFRIRLVQ